MKPLTSVPAYEKFIKERDAGLERVLTKYSIQMGGIVDALRTKAEQVASHMLATGRHKDQLKKARQHFQDGLEPYFDMAIARATALVVAMRKTSYVISAAGHSAAIAATLQKPAALHITKLDMAMVAGSESHSGGTIDLRLEIGFHRLLRDIVDAFQLSQVMSSNVTETIERIRRAFPKGQKVSKTKRVMAKMTEAAKKKDDDELEMPSIEISEEGIDPQTWDVALNDYLEEQIPFGRAPYDKLFYAEQTDEGIETYTRYSWEVEQEMTNDFIDNVRDGENESANQMGIDDFQWIAIVDTKTDECCLQRDGLTTTEIEAKIESGDIDDDCGSSAPAHFNCRCRMAPMSDDIPDTQPPDFQGFDDWLSEKGKAA